MTPAIYEEINMTEAGSRLGMPEEIITRIAKKFLAGETLALLKIALKEGNQKQCKLHLHTIKGTGASVGLAGISKFASEYEENIKNDIPFTEENLNMLEALWEDLGDRI